MASSIKIIGMGGSTTEPSTSKSALIYALKGAAEAGAETEMIDIASLKLPMYDHGLKPIPPSAINLCKKIHEADGLIWSSPMYHGTVSGLFKNAIDWMELLEGYEPKYLTNKVVGLISCAGGVQALQVINTMEYMVRAMRGWTSPLVIPIQKAWQLFDQDGNISDPKIELQLKTLGEQVVKSSQKMKE